MFVSFVIPMYNCEAYVQSCVERILHCGLPRQEFEIIMVDDGSRDGSADIAARFAGEYDNVFLFRQENAGPATARNRGLDNAKADYVWFVDADDMIETKIVCRLREIVEADKDADLLAFSYVSLYPKTEKKTCLVKSEKRFTGYDFLSAGGGKYLWNNIYRRESIGDRRFPDGIRHIEDACFNIQTIAGFGKVIALPEVGYYYNRRNVNSISCSRRLRDRVKANGDTFKVYNILYGDMLAAESERKRAFLRKELNFDVAAHIFTMLRFDNVRTVRKYIAEYRRMGLYPLSPVGRLKVDAFIALANREELMLGMFAAYIRLKRALKR